MISTQASCTDIFESGLIPVTRALENIFASTSTLSEYETVAIEKSKDRTLFQPVIAPFNVPCHNNSAVDGYAFHAQDIPLQGVAKLSIIDVAYAGKPCLKQIKQGQCIRIMTGAIMPAGLNVVAMQEHVELSDNEIIIDHRHKRGQNIRLAGEDIQQDETILVKGQLISAADIGLMASLGIAEINVYRKLKIAIASTGNELMSMGETYTQQKIYDSNRYILAAALDRPDIEIINLGILEDKPEVLLEQFKQSSLYADIIISSGGVSVGDADYTRTALKQSGQIDFWKIAIKPGRPLAFGKIGQSLFFGLPGNPVAVMVTFYQFVLPAIDKMLGITSKVIAPTMQVKCIENIRKKPGRTEIVRGIIHQDKQGCWQVKTTGKQGSGILRSMSLANAFIILEHDRTRVMAGETVTVQPFAGLF